MTNQTKLPTRLAARVALVTATGDVRADMVALLTAHGQAKVVGHSAQVAAEARRLATRFGLDADAAEVAGWLHDISAIVYLNRHETAEPRQA